MLLQHCLIGACHQFCIFLRAMIVQFFIHDVIVSLHPLSVTVVCEFELEPCLFERFTHVQCSDTTFLCEVLVPTCQQ